MGGDETGTAPGPAGRNAEGRAGSCAASATVRVRLVTCVQDVPLPYGIALSRGRARPSANAA